MGDAEKRAKFAFVLLNEHEYTVSEMCRVLRVSRQGHCQWKVRKPSAHAARDAELIFMNYNEHLPPYFHALPRA